MRRQVWGEDGNCTQQTYRVFGHGGVVFLHPGTGVNQTGILCVLDKASDNDNVT